MFESYLKKVKNFFCESYLNLIPIMGAGPSISKEQLERLEERGECS